MKKNQNNIPCKCKHSRKSHRRLDRPILPNYNIKGAELVCFFKGPGTTSSDCDCWNYKPDNLGYLEMKYKKSLNG